MNFLISYRSSEVLSATWGKLAADILAKNWDAAKAGVTSLKELIDSGVCADSFCLYHPQG